MRAWWQIVAGVVVTTACRGAMAQQPDEGDQGGGGAEEPAPQPAPTAEPPSEPPGEPPGGPPAPVPAPPPEPPKKPQKPPEDRWSWLELGAYFKPGFRFLVRPEAVPRDEVEYELRGSAGLQLEATPFEMWHARLEVEFSDEVVRAVTDVEEEGELVEKQSIPGSILQEATVSFLPTSFLTLKAGAMRIPFTLQEQSSNTELTFPTRSEPNQVFQSGSDFGALVSADVGDGIFIPSAGVFNGDSLGLGLRDTDERGVVVSIRADVNPFGAFPFAEGDHERGPFRLGLGYGMLIRPVTLYDAETGTEARSALELRFSGSLRMAVRGVYVVAEYFRRQRTDDFTSRADVADGAYTQLAVFFPVHRVLALEPIARLGFVALDQTFDPRLVGYLAAGVNLYPVFDAEEPDMVRVSLQYFGERRFTEEEEAHGGAFDVQLAF